MIKVIVVTPNGEKVNEDVEYLFLQSDDGSRGFLTNHTPLITKISKGYIRFEKEGKMVFVGIMGGVFDINNNIATIVSQYAEVEKTYEDALLKIEKYQKDKLSDSKRKMVDFVEAEKELAKNIKKVKASEL